MSKKARITFNISAIALLVAIGAQSYTNYQIDQTLKQFPYHFRDQFTLQVDEKNSDFFTRDLTFSIKHQNNEEQIAFIHTKLTTLPFFINAQSDIPQALIKKLNNSLNITIDKNIINSQFSVFGENLRSDIMTQLRDSTNTQQTLETELIYSPKSGMIDIQTALSGLNYDANAKIKGLNAKVLLSPVGESHYDITKADVDIANTDISFLNGDNTRIELENSKFSLNKKIDSAGYDLTTNLKNKLIKLSDKSIKSESEKIKIEGVELSSKQLGVPSHITFYDQLDDLNIENINIHHFAKKINDTLFNNDLFEGKLSIKNFVVPKEEKNHFILKNAVFNFSGNNKKKEASEQNTTLNIDEIGFMMEQDLLNIKGVNWHYNATDFNLLTYLDFIYKYLPEKLDTANYFNSEKDHPDFINDLKKLTTNYKTQAKTNVSLKHISLPKYFAMDNLALSFNEEPNQGDINFNNHISFDKFSLEKEAVQFTQFNWALPIKINPADIIYPLYLCSNTYNFLCSNNLTFKTYEKLQNDAFEKITAQINHSAFSTNIDTFPPVKAQQVTANLTFRTLPPKKGETFIFSRFKNADIDFKLTVPTALVSDMSASETSESAKIKSNSTFWSALKDVFNPNMNPLITLVPADKEQYQFNFEQKDGKMWLNGKNLEEFEKEQLEQQRLELERQEKLKTEQQAGEITSDTPSEANETQAPNTSEKLGSENKE